MDFLWEYIILTILISIILLWKEEKIEKFLSMRMTTEMKGVAILFIFLVHAGSEPNLLSKYGGYGVGVFLFLSGYGLYQSDQLEITKTKSFIKKRIFRLFPPVIIYLIIFTIFWMLFPSEANRVLGGHSANDFTSFIYVNFAFSALWFIPFIVFWYICYYLVLKMEITKIAKIIILFLCGLLIVLARPFEIGAGWAMILSWFLYPFCFPTGILVSYKIKEIEKLLSNYSFKPVITRISICLAIFLLVFLTWDESQNLMQKTIHYPITSLLFIIGLLILFYFFLQKHRSHFLNILGNISYEFYLFHSLLIVIFIEESKKFLFDNYSLSILVGLSASIIASLLVKKFLNFCIKNESSRVLD